MLKTKRMLVLGYLLVSAPHLVLASVKTSYYQCNTEKGVVFSQLPCADDAVKKTVTVSGASGRISYDPDTELEAISVRNRIKQLEGDIKSSQFRIEQYNADLSKEVADLRSQLTKLMDQTRRKILNTKVKQKIKEREQFYKQKIRLEENRLRLLKRRLAQAN